MTTYPHCQHCPDWEVTSISGLMHTHDNDPCPHDDCPGSVPANESETT